MRTRFKGLGVDVTDRLRDYTISRLRAFERHIEEENDENVEVITTFEHEEHGERYRVDVDVYMRTPGGGVIHASGESNDIRDSINIVTDDVDRQLRKLKSKRREEPVRQSRKHAETSLEDQVSPSPLEMVVEEKLEISKPLTLEEALMILTDRDEFFLPFKNAETGLINVVYRKKGGEFGHITP